MRIWTTARSRIVALDYTSFRTADDSSSTIIAFTPTDTEAKQKLKA